MNEVRRLDRGTETIAMARAIVERNCDSFPDFITDFDVRLGNFDGDPALFVLYNETGADGIGLHEEWVARAESYRKLDDLILPELVGAFDDRSPYSFLVPDWQWSTYPD